MCVCISSFMCCYGDGSQILDYSPPGSQDCDQLMAALEEAESLCSKVNEAVRSKENTEQLEWLQSHVHLTIAEVRRRGMLAHLVELTVSGLCAETGVQFSDKLYGIAKASTLGETCEGEGGGKDFYQCFIMWPNLQPNLHTLNSNEF